MKYLYLTAIILFLFNGCNSTSKDIIKTSINEVNTQEKNLLNELDSNKTYNIYLGDEKFSNAKFNSCIDNSCTNFTVSINNSQHNLGINENALFIFYPNVTKKFIISRIDENNFILTNLKQECQNTISTKKEDAIDNSNGNLPLCQDW